MNGRIDNELRIERTAEAKLKTMPDYVNSWYLNMKASKKTAATRCDYVNKINNFLTSIDSNTKDLAASKITETAVAKFFMSIQTKNVNGEISYTSDSYQATVWCCLNSFLGYLADHGMIEQNYAKFIDKPKNHDLDRINEHRIRLDANDFRKIISSVDDEINLTRRNRDRAILILFMNTGMRKTALSNIMINDIDFDKKELIIIDKGSKRHQYVLSDEVIEAISEWLDVRGEFDKGKGDNHLFISDHGNRMASSTMYDLVAKYTERAMGKRISPHKLRSGYCSILYGATGDIEFVRRAVGHASATTTARYVVTAGEEKRKAAEIMNGFLTA